MIIAAVEQPISHDTFLCQSKIMLASNIMLMSSESIFIIGLVNPLILGLI